MKGVLAFLASGFVCVASAATDGTMKSAPVWDLAKDAGALSEQLAKDGFLPLDSAHRFEVPQTAVRDSQAFTVEIKIRCEKKDELKTVSLLRQKTPTTGWGLSVTLWGGIGSPIALHANDASYSCGWFTTRAGGTHTFVIAARRGLTVVYWNGHVLKRFYQTIIPNLEPIRVGDTVLAPGTPLAQNDVIKPGSKLTEMEGVKLLSLKFWGPEEEYFAKGESRDFAEGFRGGPGWLLSCPTEDPAKKLPRILCYGDSILGGYGPRLIQRLKDKAYVYRWGKFETKASGDNLDSAPYAAVCKVKPFDVIVFNNGLHSLSWNEKKVSDEQLKATQRKIYRSFRENAPQAKIFWLSTTPHTSRAKNAAGKVFATGELDPVVRRINRLTAEVMSEEGVPVLDGYGALSNRLDLAKGDGYHWSGKAYDSLVDLIVAAVTTATEADYSADRDFVRAFRAGTVEIAKRKMAAGNPNLISTGGGFTGLFVWDSAFAALWARHAANEGFPVFGNLDALYAHQREDGFICREFTKEGEPCWKPEHPWAFNPPILAWAEVELYRSGVSDAKRIEKVYPKLVRFHESYEKYLKRDDGLYFSDALGCGMDDLPRMPRDVKPEEWKRGGIRPAAECVDGNRRDHLWHWLSTAWNLNQHYWNRQAGWIDMSAQMAFDCLNLSELARAIGLDAEARRWTARHDEIAACVNALCWDEEKGFYFDRCGDKIGSRYTVAAFWTLLARIPSEAQARRMAAALNDPRLFDTRVPVTSLAVSDPGYHDTGYWVGSSWPPTTYMVIRGLRAYGLEEQAKRIAKKWYNANAKIWVKEKTVREHVRSRSGKGEGGRDFCGWSALVSIALPAEMGWL